MLNRGVNRLQSHLKDKIEYAKYKYYYPVVERLNYAAHVKEASQSFKKNHDNLTKSD